MRALDGSINGQEEQATQFAMDAYTLYVNPYYVVSLYNNTEEGSKHYFMNTQRVASAQISYNLPRRQAGVVLELPASLEPYAAGTPGSINNLSDLVELFKARLNLDLNIDFPALLEPGDFTVVYSFDDYIMALDWAGCEDDDCKCEQSLFWATLEGANCQAASVIYWYHPDYLGNVEFVTNRHGKPHQFFWYSPWGEPLVQQHLSIGNFNTRYFFNSKELDEETGLYYYGARYYDPQTSIWLSVDPKAHWYPSQTPYNFTLNNPVNLIDPNGQWVKGAGFFRNLFNSDQRIEAQQEVARHPGGWTEKIKGGWRACWRTWDYGGQVGIINFMDFKKGDPKQRNGAGQWGDHDRDVFDWPDAEHKEDPQELFPMGGKPAMGFYSIGEAVMKALGVVRKWVSWGAEDEIPTQNPIEQGAPPASPPVPQSSPSNDTTIKIWKPGLRPDYKWGDDTTLSKDEAEDYIRNNPDKVIK